MFEVATALTCMCALDENMLLEYFPPKKNVQKPFLKLKAQLKTTLCAFIRRDLHEMVPLKSLVELQVTGIFFSLKALWVC